MRVGRVADFVENAISSADGHRFESSWYVFIFWVQDTIGIVPVFFPDSALTKRPQRDL